MSDDEMKLPDPEMTKLIGKHLDADGNSELSEPKAELDRLVMCDEEAIDLKNDIYTAINKRIESHNLGPEKVAEILLEMAKEAVEALAWLPQAERAAITDIESAIKWLNT